MNFLLFYDYILIMKSNKIRDLILCAIEANVKAKIPVLFVSNPGMTKTASVERFARREGYHVVSLIGSAYDRAELMGYPVNTGKEYLELLKPNWYEEVMESEAEGVPSILFIDEISTAPIDVQGSLYRLIFNRCDGKGRPLPDDCVIVSAANYKYNLPPAFHITAPSINRFCIVNIDLDTPTSMLDECLQPEEDWDKDLPVFKENKDYSLSESQYLEIVDKALRDLFAAFSDAKSSAGKLDCKWKELDGLYDATFTDDKHVLNFMSPRSVRRYAEMLNVCVKYNILQKSWLDALTDGMIGAGFGNFEGKQLEAWRKQAKMATRVIVSELKKAASMKDDESEKSDTSIEERVNSLEDAKTVRDKVAAVQYLKDQHGLTGSDKTAAALLETAQLISNEFPIDGAKMKQKLESLTEKTSLEETQQDIAAFCADLAAIDEFINLLLGTDDESMKAVAENLEKVYCCYKFYQYTAI